MENAEIAKEWFVTHEGKQFGPVSIDDLKFEAERGQLNPRLDMVWRKDMDDWIPAGDLEGIFEKNEVAANEEKAKETPAAIGPPQEKTGKEREKEIRRLQGKWEGTSRGTYLFVCYLLPVLLMAGIVAGAMFLQGKVDDSLLALGGGGLMLIFGIFALLVTVNRFTNLAMTRWWFLSLFVPILNVWTYYRLFAGPAGYAEHRKLDGVGWMLAIVYWLFVVTGIALVAATVYAIAQAPPDPESLKTPEDLLEFMKKTYAPE